MDSALQAVTQHYYTMPSDSGISRCFYFIIGGVILNRRVICVLLVMTLVAASFGIAFAETAYVVKQGDVLWKIAKQYETTWQKLAEYNKLSNPHLIFPNQKILIPGEAPATPAPAPEPEQEPSPWESAISDFNPIFGKTADSYLKAVDPDFAYDIAYELSKIRSIYRQAWAPVHPEVMRSMRLPIIFFP